MHVYTAMGWQDCWCQWDFIYTGWLYRAHKEFSFPVPVLSDTQQDITQVIVCKHFKSQNHCSTYTNKLKIKFTKSAYRPHHLDEFLLGGNPKNYGGSCCGCYTHVMLWKLCKWIYSSFELLRYGSWTKMA